MWFRKFIKLQNFGKMFPLKSETFKLKIKSWTADKWPCWVCK